jgi:hypothetical protein
LELARQALGLEQALASLPVLDSDLLLKVLLSSSYQGQLRLLVSWLGVVQ